MIFELLGVVIAMAGGSDVFSSVTFPSVKQECIENWDRLESSRSFLYECALLFNEGPILAFRSLMKEILDPQASGARKNLISGSLKKYVQENPESYEYLRTFLHDLDNYSQPTMEWHRLSDHEKIEAFLAQFEGKSDFEVLDYQLQNSGCLRRGAFNTYIDMITHAFQPLEEQQRTGTRVSGLFESSNEEHQNLLRMIRAYSSFSHHQGLLTRMKEILIAINHAHSQEMSASNLSDLFIELKTLYFIALESSQRCGEEIKEMRYFINPAETEILQRIDDLQNLL